MQVRDEWTLKKYQPEDSPEIWFFRKNLFPPVPLEDPAFGFIAYLTFKYDPRDESGLPSKEDEMMFFNFEKTELGLLESEQLSVFVASATKSGIKDFLFYTGDPDRFFRVAEEFRKLYPQYYLACEVAPDPEWLHYKDFRERQRFAGLTRHGSGADLSICCVSQRSTLQVAGMGPRGGELLGSYSGLDDWYKGIKKGAGNCPAPFFLPR